MEERGLELSRKRFLDGEVDRLRLGGYGGTVTITAVGTGLRIQTTKPTRRQRTLTPNSRAMREQAVRLADLMLERIRGRRPTAQSGRAEEIRAPSPLLTPRDIWTGYLEHLLGAVPQDVLDWGRRDIEAFLRALTLSARRAAPTCDSIHTIVLAARRLHRDRVVPLDADFDMLEPGDINRYAKRALMAGASPHTLSTYLGRFRTAIRTFREEWPRKWGDRTDPMARVKPIKTSHIKPPEIGEEQALVLMRTLRDMGDWRTYAAAIIAHESGRRIGAIGAEREGLHLDGPPLCAKDFASAEDGTLEVTWRAVAQKGEAYDRGDVTLPATRRLAQTFSWLQREHANPLGPEYPLIWDERDPRRAVSYSRLRYQFRKAWKRAFRSDPPKNLCWHGFCRTTISTIMDELGAEASAEFCGRSIETVTRVYKRVRRQKQVETARRLDEIRERVLADPLHGADAHRPGDEPMVPDVLNDDQEWADNTDPGIDVHMGANDLVPVAPPGTK